MLGESPRERAEALAARIEGAEVVESVARVGGGALPLLELPGPAVALPDASLAAALRAARPAARRPDRERPAAARHPHPGRRRDRARRRDGPRYALTATFGSSRRAARHEAAERPGELDRRAPNRLPTTSETKMLTATHCHGIEISPPNAPVPADSGLS